MTLKVTIQPASDWIGTYPVFYALDDGVRVGAAGELMLVSARSTTFAGDDMRGAPNEFRVYAPGTWKEINVEHTDE